MGKVTRWHKATEMIDEDTEYLTCFQVSDHAIIAVPKETLERLLTQAGYIKEVDDEERDDQAGPAAGG